MDLHSQDEVAHTVTESRVLQNTRHPFLTVSTARPRPLHPHGASLKSPFSRFSRR